jgi:hypothetical protein
MRFDADMVRDGFNRPEDESEDDERIAIPCCNCGKPTSWDATYQDLCYRCIRADNE